MGLMDMLVPENLRDSLANAWQFPEGFARKMFWMKRKRFLRRIQVMARAHLPMSDSIAELRARAHHSKDGVMFAALQSMEHRQRRGRSLAETFEGWLPPTDIMLIQAGDQSGYEALAKAIDDIIDLQGATTEMIGRIISGLIEPGILIFANYILILWMANNFTAKALASTGIKAGQLTGTAHTFYEIGIFATTPWAWGAPIIFGVLLGLLFASLPRWTGRRRAFLDRFLPPWTIYRSIVGAGWMLSFAKLAKAGYTYEVILDKTAALARPWLRTRVQWISYHLRRGSGLGESMQRAKSGFPGKDLIDDIATFNNRPGFEDTLDILAREWVKETTQMVKGLAFALTMSGWLTTGVTMIWIFVAFNAVQSQLTAIVQQMH